MTRQISGFQLSLGSELTLFGDPINPLGAAPKQYVDNQKKITILSQSSNYIAYSNGIIQYTVDLPILTSGQSIILTLPISNTLSTVWLDGFHQASGDSSDSIGISGLTPTTVSFTNISAITQPARTGVKFAVI